MKTEYPSPELKAKLNVEFLKIEPIQLPVKASDIFTAYWKHKQFNIYANCHMTWFYEPDNGSFTKFYAIEKKIESLEDKLIESIQSTNKNTSIVVSESKKKQKSFKRPKKVCPKCKVEKSTFAYYRSGKGIMSRCKLCVNADKADYLYRKENGLPIGKPGRKKVSIDPAQTKIDIKVEDNFIQQDSILTDDNFVHKINVISTKETYLNIRKTLEIQIEMLNEEIKRIDWAIEDLKKFGLSSSARKMYIAIKESGLELKDLDYNKAKPIGEEIGIVDGKLELIIDEIKAAEIND